MSERQAIVDWASKIPVHDLSDGKGLCRVIFAEDFLRALKDLPSAQTEQRWIPVTERLPKPNEKDENEVLKYYLIQDEFGDMMVAAYLENNLGYIWWEQMYAYKPIEDKVVAWMPLPEPYRPEGGKADV